MYACACNIQRAWHLASKWIFTDYEIAFVSRNKSIKFKENQWLVNNYIKAEMFNRIEKLFHDLEKWFWFDFVVALVFVSSKRRGLMIMWNFLIYYERKKKTCYWANGIRNHLLFLAFEAASDIQTFKFILCFYLHHINMSTPFFMRLHFFLFKKNRFEISLQHNIVYFGVFFRSNFLATFPIK